MTAAVIIDYGAGNLRSVEKALQRAAAASGYAGAIALSDDPGRVLSADRLILPGVGAFGACARALDERSDLKAAMTRRAREDKRPFLGICVGMQLLADYGEEFGRHAGLGWIPGVVRAFPGSAPQIPHMGWNDVAPIARHELLGEADYFYFANSFHFDADDRAAIIARFRHGEPYAALVARDNVVGAQFHPEKSQEAGARFLARFLQWEPARADRPRVDPLLSELSP